ncbi:MAG TPA: SAM-dependent chlorinase/fluorinase [Vicinamibacterales bacterium]|nr:SAM-dependent chlorinase/fluorinase [Vicinamibacterales bacterium]
MAKPIVAMLTDFGTRDHYAGSLKGVVLTLCPDAALVDISHDIPPHDILTGALELAACYRFFPAGTIFLAVVDPGVGSSRLGLAAEAGDYRFVAPDNGVLTAVFAETPPKRVVSLTERRYARPTISKTFEGRDRFAPAAAWLARGAEVKALGSAVRDYVRLEIPQPQQDGDGIAGAVLRVDRFGNLVTNIPRAMVERLASRGAIRITAGSTSVDSLVETYAGVAPGTICALFGSYDHLEIAENGGDAARRLGLASGASVEVVRLSDAVLG